jgi:N-formylglutamate deformylase
MSGSLEIHRDHSPLIVSFPHTGTDIPPDVEAALVSPWLSRKDADWWVHLLYDMVPSLRATTIRTTISRTVIDVNRDPTGASLYPGQATTELCPLTTFDGEPLYKSGREPDTSEIARRRERFFAPYHFALEAEIERLHDAFGYVVLYDAHSILSHVPRLFDGELPNFNIGTNNGATCDAELTRRVEAICDDSRFTRVTNGRFRGGWTTRHYGRPTRNVHAIQMELACRTYMDEPAGTLSSDNWPPRYDATRAADARDVLRKVLAACIEFADSLGET